MSAFSTAGEIPPQRIWDGILARTVHGERATVSLVELDPDTAVPEHSHENEQLGLLIDGSLTFRVGDEVRELGPGSFWCIHANLPHSVVVGGRGAVLVEVFAPIRSDWAEIEREEPRPTRWP
jgi:unsaturated pyranuronate lyase